MSFLWRLSSAAVVAAALPALIGTPVAGADPGPQPKVENVENVHWSQEADGSETVAYDAATFASSNLEGDAKKRDRMGS